MKPGENGDEENIRREKMKIGEIQRVLDEINEGMDAELRADVPKVLQQRVRDMLSNWIKHSGVALADESRAHLDSAIVGLLRTVCGPSPQRVGPNTAGNGHSVHDSVPSRPRRRSGAAAREG